MEIYSIGGICLSDKRPIFYSALLLTGVNLLLRLISTGFQVYLSGEIGAEGIGLLQLVLSVGMLAMTAAMGGIRTATMYLCADAIGQKKPGKLRKVLFSCTLYSILISASISSLLYFFAPQIARIWIGHTEVLPALRLYCVFLPISCLCGVMTGYYTAAGRIGTMAAVEIGEQFFSMGVTLSCLLLFPGTAADACRFVILGSGSGATLTLILLFLLANIPEEDSPEPVLGKLLDAAVPLALADDLKAGISTTENLMVPKRLALYPGAGNPLASFGVVCGMVFPVLMFPAAILFSLAELLIPELARCHAAGSKRRIPYLARRSLYVALLYGCFFGGLMFLLAEPLCLALYKSREAGYYLRLYALLIPMLYTDAITDAMTKGMGQQKANVRYNIFTSTLDVVFLFLLLPRYGMGGYFFSFLVTHLINFLLSLRRLLKITQLKLNYKKAFLSLFCAMGATYLCTLCPGAVLPGILYIPAFFCLLTLLGVVRKADFLWLKSLINVKKAEQS